MTTEYREAVRSLVARYLSEDAQYLEKLISVMSVIQLGRGKLMNGSHAQMFKGLFKAFGPSAVAPFQVHLPYLSYTPSRFLCPIPACLPTYKGHSRQTPTVRKLPEHGRNL